MERQNGRKAASSTRHAIHKKLSSGTVWHNGASLNDLVPDLAIHKKLSSGTVWHNGASLNDLVPDLAASV